MIKVLVGDDTPNYGVNIANQLRNYGFYAYTRKKDGNILLNSIKNDSPDIALIDLTIVNIDAIALMRRIKKSDVHQTAFIVTSMFENSFVEKQVMENGASYFLLRPFDCEALCSIINAIVQDNEQCKFQELEEIVTDTIYKMGVPAHIKGYNYLRTAILSSIENRRLLESITKKLYPTVADTYNTTASRVERAIRHAIGVAWSKGNEEILTAFSNSPVSSCNDKPTNSEFIAFVTDKLRIKYKF